MLRKLDRGRGKIRFTDIAAAEFDASEYGHDQDWFMARIQGRTSDGQWLEGVDVFRALYTSVGLGPVVQLTRLPGVRQALDVAYVAFAKNRLRLTGRSGGGECDEGVCTPVARPDDVTAPAT